MERPIESILEKYTLDDLRERVELVAMNYEHILGVLAIGSLIQLDAPDDFYTPRHAGRAGAAYEEIRNPNRRKNHISHTSDLDIWICTEDTLASERSRPKVDSGGAALVEELASGTLHKGSAHWRSKKEQAFGQHYKQKHLYHDESSAPWLAQQFKRDLEQAITLTMPDFARNINSTFTKELPGDFLEVRAYPESLFNLRPDEAVLPDGSEDRSPFPRIADDQWISTEHNAYIFYAKDSVSIYPFVKDGEVLGSSIGDHIDKLSCQERDRLSYGGIMLKPDAFQSEDIELIRRKIRDAINDHGGRIVVQQKIEMLTDENIDEIYPLMNEADIADVRSYLQSGPVEVIIAELPADPYETFRVVNSIKGPRVGDRSISRLFEGRVLDGAVRDLLPLPGDEEDYKKIIPKILKKRVDPTIRFTEEEYRYYAKNLMHTPDNSIELNGLTNAINTYTVADAEEQIAR